MLNARQHLDRSYLEMRWRVLSLAADFDRIERAEGGEGLLRDEPRLARLCECLQIILQESERAARVQQLLSDQSPPPSR
jgi:hypothetical protein